MRYIFFGQPVPKGQNFYNPQRKLGVATARYKTYQPQRGGTHVVLCRPFGAKELVVAITPSLRWGLWKFRPCRTIIDVNGYSL